MTLSRVDAGVYNYFLNGQVAAVTERWQRSRLPSGDWSIGSTRSAPGVELSVQAQVTDGLVTAFEVCWLAQGEPELTANYQLAKDRVDFTCSEGGRPAGSEQLPFPDAQLPPLLSPLMRIFAGTLIARLLERGGVGTVMLPSISDPAARAGLLRPVLSERSARVLDTHARLELDGASISCRRCEYLGDQYGPGSEFWLGEDELLLRYQWQQSPGQQWDVRLQRDV